MCWIILGTFLDKKSVLGKMEVFGYTLCICFPIINISYVEFNRSEGDPHGLFCPWARWTWTWITWNLRRRRVVSCRRRRCRRPLWYSVLSPQYRGLSTEYSVLRTQYSVLCTE